MKKYKYYNNTNGVVQSATRNNITNKVEVVVKVSSGQLGVSTSEVYPITFMAMDDTLFTGFSESCTYNASTDEYTLFFPGTSISEETIAKFMYPSAEWELRVTQTELNELFNEVYQLTGNLVTTPEITGPDAPIVYQGTYANEYSFTASPTLAGNTISSFLVDVSGIGTQVITAADNAGTYTLKIPTTISAGTKLDMYVTATDSQGWKSSPAYKQLTVVAPYVKVPTVVKPTEGQEVIAINFDIQSSTFATEGLADTCSKTEFQIQNSAGTTVYTKELTGTTYTATITDANLQRGVLYRIRCRQFGTTLTTPSAWSDFVSFRTADIYIQAPTVISPVTGNQIFKYNVVISGDPFAVVGGETDTHTASQYRVQNVLGTNIYDSGEKTDALTSITIPELTEAVVGETYKISMRYKGATYGWSDWSTDVTVSIKPAYVNAPVLTAPTQNAQIKGTTVAFVQQGFTTSGTTDTQSGVQYQLLAADNSVYYDSGELTTDYTAHTATITKPITDIALRARARNKGTNLGWSAWSEYVNITVSPSLHLTLSDDGKLLYVGKPDGSPFDRPDGTYYWLGVDTVNTLPPSASISATTRGLTALPEKSAYVYDTAGTGSITSHTIAELRANPGLIDTTMCSVGSTQDGEYSTTLVLAAGLPNTRDALVTNTFAIGQGISKANRFNKYSHIPSKRELIHLFTLKDDINTMMGTSFFSTHVAAESGYNFSSTMHDYGKIWIVRLSGSTVQCYTTSITDKITSTYNNHMLTINCDSLGIPLQDKHNVDYPEDTNYLYRGLMPNMPLFDYYGKRFWAVINKSSNYSSMDPAKFDTVISQYSSNQLNDAANNSSNRGNAIGSSVYPFQLYAACVKSPGWCVTTKPIGVKVGNNDVYYVSPLVNLIAFYVYPLVTTVAGFFSGVKTSQNSTPTVSYNNSSTSIMGYTTTPDGVGPKHHLMCFYEYLPSETGRKLYRHSSGMGTVMEYTDADSIKKKVLILDASYRSTGTSASTNVCPSTLKQIAPSATEDISNAVANQYVTDSVDTLRLPISDSYLNKVWPADKVDSHSSAYNTQQWLELATDPAAAQYASAITVAGTACQVPNLNVALRIFIEANNLDALDPTLSANATKALGDANPNGFFGIDATTKSLATSSIAWSSPGYIVRVTGTTATRVQPTTTLGICPVLELAA
jgi:hypothetical protein